MEDILFISRNEENKKLGINKYKTPEIRIRAIYYDITEFLRFLIFEKINFISNFSDKLVNIQKIKIKCILEFE